MVIAEGDYRAGPDWRKNVNFANMVMNTPVNMGGNIDIRNRQTQVLRTAAQRQISFSE